MKKTIWTISVLPILGFMWWYFAVLLVRTDFLRHPTNAANDVLQIMYMACVSALSMAIYAVIAGLLPRVVGYAVLFAALIPAIGFTTMNASELVCMSKEAGQCISLFSREYPLISFIS